MTVLERLQVREFWTPTEAALVLGRGHGFWRTAFDRGEIRGYRAGSTRYLLAESARDYLMRRVRERDAAAAAEASGAKRALMDEWRTMLQSHVSSVARRAQ